MHFQLCFSEEEKLQPLAFFSTLEETIVTPQYRMWKTWSRKLGYVPFPDSTKSDFHFSLWKPLKMNLISSFWLGKHYSLKMFVFCIIQNFSSVAICQLPVTNVNSWSPLTRASEGIIERAYFCCLQGLLSTMPFVLSIPMPLYWSLVDTPTFGTAVRSVHVILRGMWYYFLRVSAIRWSFNGTGEWSVHGDSWCVNHSASTLSLRLCIDI